MGVNFAQIIELLRQQGKRDKCVTNKTIHTNNTLLTKLNSDDMQKRCIKMELLKGKNR